MVVVVAECPDGRLNPASAEAVAAATRLGPDVTLIVTGDVAQAALTEAAALPVLEVVQLTHEALGTGTAEVMTAALASILGSIDATHVLWAHTYQARDYVPRLAARLGRPLLTDCVAIIGGAGGATFTRAIHQGRLSADVVFDGPGPYFVTIQAGAFPRDALSMRTGDPAPIRRVPVEVPADALRVRAEPPVRETRQEVNLSKARRIVAVGRGIREAEQLEVVRRLAAALDAELGASRPVCDAGWLPMDRQIGSSGQTVAPQLYVAVGVSGAIQHIVGMKGAKTVVAINRDADAPIFEIADYGVVGDLFEVVPALTAALEGR